MSDPEKSYDLSKLIAWIQRQLPHLYTVAQLKRKRSKKALGTKYDVYQSGYGVIEENFKVK